MTVEEKKHLNAIAKAATLSDQIVKMIDELEEIQTEYDIYETNGIHFWFIKDAREQFATLACTIGYEEDDEDVEADDDGCV